MGKKPALSEWHPWISHGTHRVIRTELLDSSSVAVALRRKGTRWVMSVYPPDGTELGGDYFDDINEGKAAADKLWAEWKHEPSEVERLTAERDVLRATVALLRSRVMGLDALLDEPTGHPGEHSLYAPDCIPCNSKPDEDRPWWRWDDENPDVVAHRDDGARLEQVAGGWRASNGWTLADRGRFIRHADALTAYDTAHPMPEVRQKPSVLDDESDA